MALDQISSLLRNLKCPSNRRKFWQPTCKFWSLHIICGKLWETTKTIIMLTYNKSVTQFYQTKSIPPSLWNACDYVFQFYFKIEHTAVSVNRAADIVSRLELKVTEKIRLKIRGGIELPPIEVTTFSSDVAFEEIFFFT